MNSLNGHAPMPPEEEAQSQFDKLADSIDRLTSKVEDFMNFASDAVPTKVVYIIFGLVFALLFGVESVRFIFEHYLPSVVK